MVGEGQSQLDIIRLARTHAPEINLTTEQIVQRLQQYSDKFELDLWFAETNVLRFNIIGEVKNIPALARYIVQFCPDELLMKGALEYLEARIARSRDIHLIWDIEAGYQPTTKPKSVKLRPNIKPRPVQSPTPMNAQQRQQAQQLLHNITGLEVRPYSTYDFGRQQDP